MADVARGVLDRPVASLAELVGATEPALRLLLTVLAGYPIGRIYRSFVQEFEEKAVHHLFFALTGLGLCYFNYGLDTYHSLVAIIFTYAVVHLLRGSPRKWLLTVNFVGHMAYLLIGYLFTESNEYDITWTMPHCVLVLRMIGFGFDVADGLLPESDRSKDQKESCLEKVPTFLELLAFAYFPCSFLVGPQFPYKRYKSFVDGEYRGRDDEHRLLASNTRLAVGVFYLILRQVGAAILSDDYMLSEEYRQKAFLTRLIYMGLWGKLALYKYTSCWLLAEGAIIRIGLAWKDKEDWSACSNVNLRLFEFGYTMEHYVQSFNVNTNNWVAVYVYKRLKFLGNRTISYAAALTFLALWHGFHSGYYMAFLLEYLTVTAERRIASAYGKLLSAEYRKELEASLTFRSLRFFILKTYNIIYMGWCMGPFVMLSYDRWLRFFSAVNYFGFIFLAVVYLGLEAFEFCERKAKASLERREAGHIKAKSGLTNRNEKDD